MNQNILILIALAIVFIPDCSKTKTIYDGITKDRD